MYISSCQISSEDVEQLSDDKTGCAFTLRNLPPIG